MGKPYILLVEDDNNDEVLTKLALEENSVEIDLVVVRDGVEALDFMFAQGKHINRNLNEVPQVILLDLKLPKVNGMEVLSKIKKNDRTRYIPVVIFTSSKEECDIEMAYSLGANSFVFKPIDFSEYSSAIQQIGLFWTLLNRTPSLEKQKQVQL